ncbi:MAG: YicC/YloC family endoribonuclease [Verrucomicrobiota bacterium]
MLSMTGYGRGEATAGDLKYTVETSSLNRKQIEVVVNLPRRLANLEGRVREVVVARIARGRVTVQVGMESTKGRGGALEVDEDLAVQYRDALAKLEAHFGKDLDMDAVDLLRAPGVFTVSEGEVELEETWPVLEEALGKALDELVAMEEREGEHLKSDLQERVGTLSKEVSAVEARAPGVVKHHREALMKRLEEAGLELALDDERIVREVALYADRCDITEECTRLASHFKQFGLYFESAEPVGRSMDFLCQETNRELNTIGSKANDAEIAQHVVNARTELEKIREQVQNVQ